MRVAATMIEATNSATRANYSYVDDEVEFDIDYRYWLQTNDLDGTTEMFGPVNFKISSQDDNDIEDILLETLLLANYPNPYNPETTFHFFVKTGETAELTIYNLKGDIVSSNLFETGEHKYIWNGTNKLGKKVASGIYLYKLISDSYNKANKMILMK